jgi:hypothetical protein
MTMALFAGCSNDVVRSDSSVSGAVFETLPVQSVASGAPGVCTAVARSVALRSLKSGVTLLYSKSTEKRGAEILNEAAAELAGLASTEIGNAATQGAGALRLLVGDPLGASPETQSSVTTHLQQLDDAVRTICGFPL